MTCNGAVRVLWDPYRGIIVDEVQDLHGEGRRHFAVLAGAHAVGHDRQCYRRTVSALPAPDAAGILVDRVMPAHVREPGDLVSADRAVRGQIVERAQRLFK